jgi:hypothetical protein
MIDYTLKFDSEEQGLSVTDGFDINTNHLYAVDIIGTVPGMTGYYVNLRLSDEATLPAALGSFVVQLDQPIRVWA